MFPMCNTYESIQLLLFVFIKVTADTFIVAFRFLAIDIECFNLFEKLVSSSWENPFLLALAL